MSEKNQQTRVFQTNLDIRESQDNQEMAIEGYFAVFNRETELWPGAREVIAPGAFSESLGNDIRALINHESRLVLGRTKAGTLQLKEDSFGLWGRITINPRDVEAVNLYERVKRGDVNQCSFGFNILEEDTEILPDGSIRWIIRKVDLHEVSVVTFPAYRDTSVQARKADMRRIQQQRGQTGKTGSGSSMSSLELERRKEELLVRLRRMRKSKFDSNLIGKGVVDQ